MFNHMAAGDPVVVGRVVCHLFQAALADIQPPFVCSGYSKRVKVHTLHLPPGGTCHGKEFPIATAHVQQRGSRPRQLAWQVAHLRHLP
jgi:hypothetical protein